MNLRFAKRPSRFSFVFAGISLSLSATVLTSQRAIAQDRLTTVSRPVEATSSEPVEVAEATSGDVMRALQTQSVETGKPIYGHWGVDGTKFSSWTNHSNRLIPVYTFGLTLSQWREQGTVHADRERLEKLRGGPAEDSFNPTAVYYDQFDIYQLQRAAVDAGYTNIIMIVFDGMDWQTTRAAAIYKTGRIPYESGRGTGLAMQDDRRVITDYGLVTTSAAADTAKIDVSAQRVISIDDGSRFGYNVTLGGRTPWNEHIGSPYLIGEDRSMLHTVTDSASSASTLFSGIKTYNAAINVTLDGSHVLPLGRELQRDQDFMVGVVTSVPVSHATPAAAYANNVTRKDYQDISRDMVGLPSSSHRDQPLPGVDVLIGGGWGEDVKEDEDNEQGTNFAQGNKYFHQDDLARVDLQNGGQYRVAQRKPGVSGREVLMTAAQASANNSERLLGFFGTKGGHLPFATADGRFDPTVDVNDAEQYSEADIFENPTLADMTEAALLVLEQSIDGFWLLIEAGDVDWANHSNNLDNSIGAVLSGEAAFVKVMDWVDENNAWDHTAVIVTADHGHYLVIDSPAAIAAAGAERGMKE